MKPEKFSKLTEISNKIIGCTECKFHKELDESIPYKPDAPLGYTLESQDYKAIAIGINPSWKNEDYNSLRDIYKETDLEKYKDRLVTWWGKNNTGRQPYRDGVYSTFKIINAELGTYEDEIKKERIYEYVFWSNLSFCNSQNIWERKFGDKKLSCNIVSEEIPNCLKNGYLKSIIETLEPKLVMFFGYEAVNFFNFTKIFDIKKYHSVKNYYKQQFPSHKRGEKTIDATIIACKLKASGKQIYVLFLPHPNYRFNNTLKEGALKEVCKWLQETE